MGNITYVIVENGMFTEETEKLYENTDLVIHESYVFDKKIDDHSSIKNLMEMAKRNNIKCLALTHIQRDLRKKELNIIKNELSKEKIRIIIPTPFEEYP